MKKIINFIKYGFYKSYKQHGAYVPKKSTPLIQKIDKQVENLHTWMDEQEEKHG